MFVRKLCENKILHETSQKWTLCLCSHEKNSHQISQKLRKKTRRNYDPSQWHWSHAVKFYELNGFQQQDGLFYVDCVFCAGKGQKYSRLRCSLECQSF